jgi:hypothetical protein
MDVNDQLHASAALPPGPIVQEAGWAPEQVWTLWRREESLAASGNRTPTVQPIVRRYTD